MKHVEIKIYDDEERFDSTYFELRNDGPAWRSWVGTRYNKYKHPLDGDVYHGNHVYRSWDFDIKSQELSNSVNDILNLLSKSGIIK